MVCLQTRRSGCLCTGPRCGWRDGRRILSGRTVALTKLPELNKLASARSDPLELLSLCDPKLWWLHNQIAITFIESLQPSTSIPTEPHRFGPQGVAACLLLQRWPQLPRDCERNQISKENGTRRGRPASRYRKAGSWYHHDVAWAAFLQGVGNGSRVYILENSSPTAINQTGNKRDRIWILVSLTYLSSLVFFSGTQTSCLCPANKLKNAGAGPLLSRHDNRGLSWWLQPRFYLELTLHILNIKHPLGKWANFRIVISCSDRELVSPVTWAVNCKNLNRMGIWHSVKNAFAESEMTLYDGVT